MVPQDTVLVMLVKLVERIPVPAPPPRHRGHPSNLDRRFCGEALCHLPSRKARQDEQQLGAQVP
jgi:hypothetical protein